MTIVLPPRQHKPGFYESLVGGLSKSIPAAIENSQAQKEMQRKEALLSQQASKKAEQEERLKNLDIKSKERIPFLKEKAKSQRQQELLQQLGILQGEEGEETSQNDLEMQSDRQKPLHERITPEQELGLSIVNPQAANTISKQREFAQKQKQHEEKQRTDIHKETAKFDTQLREKAENAKKQIEAIKDIRESIQSGKVHGGTLSSIFKGFGTVGDKISSYFKTAEQGKFEANIPLLLEGWKDVFGVRLSDSDLKLLLDKLPSIQNDPKANESILKVIEKYADPLIVKEQVAREIKKENGGYRPLDFEDQVTERTEKRLEDKRGVRIRNKATGKVVRIPKDQVQNALQNGGELVNE